MGLVVGLVTGLVVVLEWVRAVEVMHLWCVE